MKLYFCVIVEECAALAEDLSFLSAKFLPISSIGQACLEEDGDGIHGAIAKAENCRY